jgi:hypothetical protein
MGSIIEGPQWINMNGMNAYTIYEYLQIHHKEYCRSDYRHGSQTQTHRNNIVNSNI